MRIRDLFFRRTAAGVPLDNMFGAGTAAAFASRVDISAQFPNVTATTLEWVAADGSVGTETRWVTKAGALAGFYRLNYAPPTVHCVALVVEPGFRGKGVLTQLCASLNQWWPTLGLTRNTMSTEPGSNAEKMLRLAGFGPQEDGSWGCPLPSQRLEEVITYLKAKQEGLKPAQPAWRSVLPTPSEELF